MNVIVSTGVDRDPKSFAVVVSVRVSAHEVEHDPHWMRKYEVPKLLRAALEVPRTQYVERGPVVTDEQAKVAHLQHELDDALTMRGVYDMRCSQLFDDIAALKTGKHTKKKAPLNYRRTKL